MSDNQSLADNIQDYVEEYTKIFQNVYNNVLLFAKDKLDKADNVVDFLMLAMTAVNEHGRLHGFEKKEIVKDVVAKLVETMTIDDEQKDELRRVVTPHLDETIDFMIAAAKGYLFLEKVGDKVEEGFQKCCLPCKRKSRRRGGARQPKTFELPPHRSITGLADIIYDKVRGMITSKSVSISNIVSIVTIVMQFVQQYPALAGGEKKQIVKHVIYRLIDEIPINPLDREGIKAFLNTTLDKTIDYVISVARGDIDLIGKISDVIDKCGTSCGGCCGKKE